MIDNATPSAPYTGAIRPRAEVRDMFASITPRYDFLNHALSFGIDLRWRTVTAKRLEPQVEGMLLDVCCGTGDLAVALGRCYGERKVIGVDFCEPMLEIAKQKLEKKKLDEQISVMIGDALALPFQDDTFAASTVAFGIRNVASLSAGVAELTRVVKPGGTVAILEFTRPTGWLVGPLYLFYLRCILPVFSRILTGLDTDAYRYLSKSVMAFANPEELKTHMGDAGLKNITATPLTFGVATLFTGMKI